MLDGNASRAALFLLCSLVAGMGPCLCQDQSPLGAEIEQTRQHLRQEAIDLYAAILEGKPQKLSRCGISNEWLDARVYEEDAMRYFNVNAHASLSASDHRTKPAEVIDPKGTIRQVFCDEAETKANDKQNFAEFKTSFETGKSKRFTTAQWSYSFPIFNKDYTRAAVESKVEWRDWWDPQEAGGWEGSSDTEIYEKRDGAWAPIAVANIDGGRWEGSAPPLE